jgi:hypothetical protein
MSVQRRTLCTFGGCCDCDCDAEAWSSAYTGAKAPLEAPAAVAAAAAAKSGTARERSCSSMRVSHEDAQPRQSTHESRHGGHGGTRREEPSGERAARRCLDAAAPLDLPERLGLGPARARTRDLPPPRTMTRRRAASSTSEGSTCPLADVDGIRG